MERANSEEFDDPDAPDRSNHVVVFMPEVRVYRGVFLHKNCGCFLFIPWVGVVPYPRIGFQNAHGKHNATGNSKNVIPDA